MNQIFDYLRYLFFDPISNYNIFEFVITSIIVLAALYGAYRLIKLIFKGLKLLFTDGKKKLSFRGRCQNTQCPTCGRSLDRCVCVANRDLGYYQRWKRYKKLQKMKKKIHKN